MDDTNGLGQKRVVTPVIVRQDQNTTAHENRLLREGQLTKCQGKGLRPMAGMRDGRGVCTRRRCATQHGDM